MNIKSPFFPYIPFLGLISFISFFNILSRVIFSPLTPLICKEMRLCHGDAGNIFLVLSLGFATTLVLSQYLSAKFSHKFTIIFSVLITGLAIMLTADTTSFQHFRLAIFFVGIGSGFFVPSAVALIRENIPNYHLGKAFGIFGTAQSFAFILSPVLVRFFIQFYSWREILNGFGLIAAIFSLFLFFMIRKKEQKSVPITFSFIKEVFSWPSFWILNLFLCLINGLNIGVYSMAPDYFERHSLLASDDVSHLIIIGRSISIITAIIGGYVADYIGLKKSLVIVLVLCGLITAFIGMTTPKLGLILFCIQSPIAACLMPIIHFGVATISPIEKNAAIVSVMAPFGFTFGAGIIPQILGFFGDFNLYSEGFIIFGITSLVCALIFSMNAVYKHIHFSQLKNLEEQ